MTTFTRIAMLTAFVMLVASLFAAASAQAALVGYWDFENTLSDATANSNDGVYHQSNSPGGSPAYAIDVPAQLLGSTRAINFGALNTTDDSVKIPDTVLNAAEGTVAAWFNSPLTNNTGVFGNQNNGTASNTNRVYIRVDGETLHASLDDPFDSASGFSHRSLTGEQDKWHHGTLVWRTNGTSSLYLDGIADTDSNTHAMPSNDGTPQFNVRIGSFANQGAFQGLIDDTAVWDTALTEGEVRGLINIPDLHVDLSYDVNDAEELYILHRSGSGSANVDGLVWSYAENLPEFSGHSAGDAYIDGLNFVIYLDASANSGLIAAVPVPEPSSFLLLGLGALGLVRHTQRRRRRA